MPNILDEYLIKLGATVDQAGLRRFETALRESARFSENTLMGMAGTMFKVQAEIVGGFAAIGGAAIGLVDKVAMADQQYRLFALHMFMSKDAARGLKIAMDSLGESLEDMTWDPELRGRTRQLLEDQRRMAPGQDFEQQMRKIRDMRFEFTRMEVELKYMGMHIVQDFMKALGFGPDEMLTKLRKFNEWIIVNMPMISKKLAREFMPIWRDIQEVAKATGRALYEAGVLFTNIVGLLTGDTSITGATLDFEKLAKAIEHVAGGFAYFANLIASVEERLAHLASAAALIASGKMGEAATELKAAVGGATVKGVLTTVGAGVGVLGGPMGVAAGTAAGLELGSAWEHMTGQDTGTPQGRNLLPNTANMSSLVRSIIMQESGGNPNAVSSRGAIGLMQLMPGTAKSLGVDPYDAKQNVEGGTRYITQLLHKYQGDVARALAAYNWGPGNLDAFLAGKTSRMPTETQDYVSKVMGRMGGKGDVTVGNVTIHIGGTNATPREIQMAVASGIGDAANKRVQRNLAEFGDLSWSY